MAPVLHVSDSVTLHVLIKSGVCSVPASFRVSTSLENLEISGNLTAVREMSAILLKVREVSRKNLVRKKWPKTVYC